MYLCKRQAFRLAVSRNDGNGLAMVDRALGDLRLGELTRSRNEVQVLCVVYATGEVDRRPGAATRLTEGETVNFIVRRPSFVIRAPDERGTESEESAIATYFEEMRRAAGPNQVCTQESMGSYAVPIKLHWEAYLGPREDPESIKGERALDLRRGYGLNVAGVINANYFTELADPTASRGALAALSNFAPGRHTRLVPISLLISGSWRGQPLYTLEDAKAVARLQREAGEDADRLVRPGSA